MKWIITNDKDFWKLQLTLPQLFADTYVNKCYFRNSQLITFFKLTSCIQSVVIWYPAVKPLLRKKKNDIFMNYEYGVALLISVMLHNNNV